MATKQKDIIRAGPWTWEKSEMEGSILSLDGAVTQFGLDAEKLQQLAQHLLRLAEIVNGATAWEEENTDGSVTHWTRKPVLAYKVSGLIEELQRFHDRDAPVELRVNGVAGAVTTVAANGEFCTLAG
jgi:hypothetical protein